MKIGIVAAMEEEKHYLLERMHISGEVEIAGWTFVAGQLAGKRVVLVQSGIGKVMSAIATTLLIHHFKVDFVINTGSAGGLGKGLKIGDVVIANNLAYSDVDVTGFNYDYGQLPGLPARFETSHKFLDGALEAAKEVGLQAHVGLIVSADAFIHTEAPRQAILRHFPDVLATEMEGAAIAQTCYTFKVPFLVIRAISDIPESGESAVSFDQFIVTAGKKSAQMVCLYIKHM
ncbi:5'-methylthioadenosine/adenosylhomocysteine nucleosidase [Granulicatella seriolae]|uniref:5'-methylthioadenosine/S-adenosylhomocysteine nucleosidase n=1 Tax=Granulicatella seriolae TaxID=2967226 RepID=A0ABT1WLQ9_9LACT|nr:5'-methylthioadenosine/adenosylhomocysteine nucleosidase [Granulicatella seriolae]